MGAGVTGQPVEEGRQCFHRLGRCGVRFFVQHERIKQPRLEARALLRASTCARDGAI